MVIIGLFVTMLQIKSSSNDYKNQINDLEKELQGQREVENVVALTKEFIEKSSVGQQKDLLTGSAKEMYEKALANKGISEDEHLENESSLEDVNIINVFSERNENNSITSYAMYQSIYEMNPNSDTEVSQRIVSFSLTATWDKTKDGYKVSDYKIDLLKDSLDDYLLKEMSENNG
uniref:Uncharacterized protein n=1 Tax=Aeromonas sp. Ne-1 TaxID=1675689 RepID=A0A0H4JMZ6_9GAMM|nr:hypothetical protein [Aeromonas sp. Ne-1]AKO69701.1 hypothetical protein [Aeromonas sp. Ne-1]